jgi:DNA integrity scanning protein DisA with diadenylate cyclase activity
MRPSRTVVTEGIPHIDFTAQFNLSKSFEKIHDIIWDLLQHVLSKRKSDDISGGLLLVYGDFDKSVFGVYQMGQNPLSGTLLSVSDDGFEGFLLEHMANSNNDGAILVNRDGQVLGANIYLMVDSLDCDIPEESGTRHLAACSFSKRKDVFATFVLSETRDRLMEFRDAKMVEKLIFTDNEKKSAPKKKGAKVE